MQLVKGIGVRVAALAPVVFGVSVLTFLLMNLLPGGPVEAILGTGATPQTIHALTRELHLDRPLPTRYLDWIGGLFHGDLGTSYTYHLPVSQLLVQRLPVTVELIVVSQILALLLAVPLGIATGYRARTLLDRVVTGAAFGLIALP